MAEESGFAGGNQHGGFSSAGQHGGFVEQQHPRGYHGRFTGGGGQPGAGGGGQAAVTVTAYHGTNAEFDEFSDAHIGSATDDGFMGKGFYFSTDPGIGRTNNRTIKATVTLGNPLMLQLPDWGTPKKKLVLEALEMPVKPTSGAEITEELKKRGHDGVVLDYSLVGYHHQEVMAMKASQIKIEH